MEAFIDAMQEYSGKLPEKPKTWMEAFRILKLYLKKKVTLKRRCIVFLDELPSMDTQRSGFVRALGYFWNSWASLQDNLTLIVCGNATSWMIRNIVNDKGGLHDRITHELHLHPFIQVAGIVYDHRQSSGKSQGRNVARRIDKGFGSGFKRIAQRKT